jgi:hypothetical protein
VLFASSISTFPPFVQIRSITVAVAMP